MPEAERTIVPVDLGDGVRVLVEARRAGSPEQQVGITRDLSFDGVEKSITAISRRVAAAVQTVKPDKVAVEFGVDASFESGALSGLLVKGSGAANLTITLEWENSSNGG